MNLKKLLLGFLFIPLITVFLHSPVYARSGCCSWHGGVCGHTCCDGSTLSAVCSPYYNPPAPIQPIYYPPPDIPPTKANYELINKEDGTIDLLFTFDNSEGSDVSISLNSVAGGDPGPIADTTSSLRVFTSVPPGISYVNMKKRVNGVWSKVGYWTIPIPLWTAPTPTPDVISASASNNGKYLVYVLLLTSAGAFVHALISKFNKS